ncbi:MAG: hypothetical protein ACREA9_16170 [Pyrinomonadaceae bacterium]
MRNMNCRNIRREIEEAGSADLLSEAAHSHLKACAACETLSRQQTNLQAIVSSLGTVEAPGDFDFRLRARLAGEKRWEPRSLPLRSLSFGFRSAAIAAILLLIGSAVVFVAFKTRSDNPVAGGRQVAPKPATAYSGPKQVGIPSGEAPGPNQVAGGPNRNEPSVVETGLRPSERTRNEPRVKNELATLPGVNRFRTQDLSSTRAPVVTRDDQLAQTYPTAAFPINASYQSLKVSVDDGRGTSRTISLPSVSFGSQRTLSQNGSPLVASARVTW